MKNKTVKIIFVLSILIGLAKFSFAADEQKKVSTVEKEKPKAVVSVAKEIRKPTPMPKVDASSFIIIKNKTPEQMFDDANYLYQLGEYESALILFNKVSTQSSDPILKRKSNTAREVIDILMKAERVGDEKAPKVYKRAEKIKLRQRNDQVAYLYNEARGKFLKGDYETATSLYRVILQLDPTQKEAKEYLDVKIPGVLTAGKIEVLYKQGVDYFDRSNYSGATNSFKEIIKLDATNQQAKEYLDVKIPQKLNEQKSASLYGEAQEALKNKEYDKAKSLCQKALALDAKNQGASTCLNDKIPAAIKEDKIKALFSEAMGAFNKQEYDQATGVFKSILALDGNHQQAKEYIDVKIPPLKLKKQKINQLYSQGVGYFNVKDFEKATATYKEIIALDAAQAQAKEYLDVKIPAAIKEKNIQDSLREGVQLFTIGDSAKATEIFKQVLSLEPEQPLAKEYLETKIPQVLKEQKIRQLYAQGQGFFNVGYYDDAKGAFKGILELSADEPIAQEYLDVKIPAAMTAAKVKELYVQGKAALAKGDYSGANDIFKEIVALSPNETEAKKYLKEKIPAAAKEFTIKELYNRGIAAFANADYLEAKSAFQEIVNLSPDEEGAQGFLAVKIPEAENKLKLKDLYKQAMDAFDNADYKKSASIFKEILAIDPGQNQAQKYLQINIPIAMRDQKVQELNKEALSAFNNENYDQAGELFAQVLALDPNQTQAREYIESKILQKKREQKQIADDQARAKQEESERARLERNREQRQRQIADDQARAKQEELDNARQERDQAQREMEISRDQARQEELENSRLREAQREREEVPASQTPPSVSVVPQPDIALPSSLDYPKEGAIGFLYERAFNAYNNGNLQEARDMFTKILLAAPKEQVAMKYLVKIIKRQKNEA